MMRRPDQLTGMRNSLGRRLIEPESFVSSSCVGDQFQNVKRHPIRKVAPATPTTSKERSTDSNFDWPGPPRTISYCLKRLGYLKGNRGRIVIKEAHRRQEFCSVGC